jgi:hypothetical protein
VTPGQDECRRASCPRRKALSPNTRCRAFSPSPPISGQPQSDSQSQSAFLRLPQELRDIIFEYALYELNGFVYGFESNNLTRTNQEPINLALTLTCRTIAEETRGLVLELNTINFYTAYTEGTRYNAGMFYSAIECLEMIKNRLAN